MVRLFLILIFLITNVGFSQNDEGEDDKWKDVEAIVQQIEKDAKLQKDIQDNAKELNEYIKNGLNVINDGKPYVLYKIGDDKYLMMGIDSKTGLPYSKVLPEANVKASLNIQSSKTFVNQVQSSLPKVVFAIASVLYAFASGYFLFMAGMNIRSGNFWYALFDLFVWAISSAIMYKILKGMA